MSLRRARSVGLVLLVILLAAGAAAGGYLLTHDVRQQRADAQRPTPPPTPSVLRAATAPPTTPASTGTAPVPRAAALTRQLAAGVDSPALSGRLRAEVLDAQTGTVLYSRHASTGAAPASTAKLLTAVAVLAVHAPSDRFTTRVVAGSDGSVVLVGGGDPTLTAAAAGKPGAYPGAARISALADQLRAAHVRVQRIVVDGSLFTGPSVSPSWAPEDVPSSYASPITALMVDGGRDAPSDEIRSAAPALAAGHALARALGKPGLPVAPGHAPARAQTLATVRSAPVSTLIEQMLQSSDNVIAECLGRLVALAAGEPASFAGATAAIRAQLGVLGVRVGAGMVDASGLAARDRLSPATLTAVLRLITGGRLPRLHSIVTALPVAAWSGTLQDRYLAGSGGARGAGVVRAKTGTLTGVSTLAGLVHDRDGRLLAFALMADRVPPGDAGTQAAEAALDRIAGVLAGCGCR